MVEAATAPEVDIVVSAIVGVAGLEATYEAVRRGKRVGLANKEVLVSGGQLVMDAVRESGAELLPIDSEHNGVHQCLRAGNRDQVSKLILTASGGPFRNTPKEAMATVTPAEALNHPTWKMGQRITIDSATLMNKGFEVIEACWLFDFRAFTGRCGDSSAIDGARHDRVQRWQRSCPDLGDGHAHADTVRLDLAGTVAGAGTEDRLERGSPLGIRASGFRAVPAVEIGVSVPGGGRLGDLHAECGGRDRRRGFSERARSGFPASPPWWRRL